MSTVGLRRVISHGIIRTKARAQMAATATMKPEPNQSSSRPRSHMISSAPRKVATSAKPTRSKPPSVRRSRCRSSTCARVSRSSSAIDTIVSRPTGPLIRKHQCQETLSDSQPPSVGPTTGATTTATPNRAKACPRFAGGKESDQDRLRDRHHAAAGDALQDAEQQQRLQVPGEGAEHRAHGEEGEAGDEEACRRPTRRTRKVLAVRLMALATR